MSCSRPLDQAGRSAPTARPRCPRQPPRRAAPPAPRRRGERSSRRPTPRERGAREPPTRAPSASARATDAERGRRARERRARRRRRRRVGDGRAARPALAATRPRQTDLTTPSKGTHGPNADPRQARRLRARADRRDHRPLRAQGPADRRAAAHDRRRASSPSATTPSTPSARSSASSSSSSPRGPIVAMVLEGDEAVKAARQVIGATNPLEAAPGSIRGDFAIEIGQNMVHGSDSPESAAREVGAVLPELSRREPRPRCSRSSSPRARRSGGRSSSSSGVAFEVARRDVDELEQGEPGAGGASRTRCARRARRARRRGASAVLGVRHDRRARRRASTASRPTSARRARRCARSPGRTHEVLSGLALLLATGAERDRGRAHARSRSATLDERAARLVRRDRRVARALRRLRDPGRAARRWSRAIDGDYENVVGLPVATLLELYPELSLLIAALQRAARCAVAATAVCAQLPLRTRRRGGVR